MRFFAYGTLMDPEIMAGVARVRCPSRAAVLDGYVRRLVRGEVYPAIRPGGESVAGVVYDGVTSDAFARLDRFEGALYERVVVSVRAGDGARVDAETYVLATGHESRLSDEPWSYGDFVANGRDAFRLLYPGYEEVD